MPPASGFGDRVQRQRGFARAFRPVDLDDAALSAGRPRPARYPAQRAGGDRLNILVRMEPLHRAFAEGAINLSAASSAFCLSMSPSFTTQLHHARPTEPYFVAGTSVCVARDSSSLA
jgi:hypothetical protein